MDSQAQQGLGVLEVQEKIRQGKVNRLPKSKEGGVGEILRRNTLTLFNLLNLALALLLIAIGSYKNVLFMGVVISNALIGTVQEIRAKRVHDRLTLMSENKVHTWRDGAAVQLSPADLVEGDVVLLRRGDQVPADGAVLEGQAHVDESILTGESLPIAKNPGDAVLSGSFLTDGKLTVRLTAVGVDSYMGKLQMSARKVKKAKSELLRDMNRIIRWVSYAVVPIGLLLYWKQTAVLDMVQNEAIVRAVASIIGMIPEGLILLTSVSLAAGVVALGQKKTLVNQLYGIESLARTDVICMDKTGTLTSGSMVLEDTLPAESVSMEEIRCSLGAFFRALGTEDATSQAIAREYPPAEDGAAISTVAFSSQRKWSAAQVEEAGWLFLGAPEKLLTGSDLIRAQELARGGKRVLALMQSPDGPGEEYALPEKRRLMCLICLRDELRPQVQETIRYFIQQDVTLKVISGDSPLTVSNIAKSAGVPDAEKYVDLSAVADKDYDRLGREYAVFGRVSPEDKRELVLAMQRDGHGVAMMGDGVNDIPALKTADCSVAMPGGSDAASRVAQMTLLSGGFDAMPQILLEGRRVINNITRASALFLVKNIFSMLLSLALMVLPYAYPFQPIQLTLVSTLTIGFPSFVLALQPSREKASGNFLMNIFLRALPGGLCVALLLLAGLTAGHHLGLTDGQISTVCTLVAAFSCFIVLLLTCRPLNALRAALLVVVAAGVCIAVLVFPGLFSLSPITGWVLWLSIILCALALPLQLLIAWVMSAIGKGRKAATGAAQA